MILKYRDPKDKNPNRYVKKNVIITNSRDLKGFTKQVEEKHITDEHFKKAYDIFKKPPYGQKEE